MALVTLRGHYDGSHIQLDDAYKIKQSDRLLITVLPDSDTEDSDWHLLSLQNLERAYSADEPDYPLSLIKEPNPDYEGR